MRVPCWNSWCSLRLGRFISVVGVLVCIPGTKSGLFSRGVKGPGVGVNWSSLQAALKVFRVALMNWLCAAPSGILFCLIHGKRFRGIAVKAFSSLC